MLTPSSRKTQAAAQTKASPAGLRHGERRRWSLLQRDVGQAFLPVSSANKTSGSSPTVREGSSSTEAAEEIARILLKRYGVVFKRLLEREGIALPWRVLLRIYHRLEARGEIRGGRFVAGISGEQFALPEAVGMLRAIRRARTGAMDFGFRSPRETSS